MLFLLSQTPIEQSCTANYPETCVVLQKSVCSALCRGLSWLSAKEQLPALAGALQDLVRDRRVIKMRQMWGCVEGPNTHTQPGELSPTWESYRCLLWHHKGVIFQNCAHTSWVGNRRRNRCPSSHSWGVCGQDRDITQPPLMCVWLSDFVSILPRQRNHPKDNSCAHTRSLAYAWSMMMKVTKHCCAQLG